METSVRELSVDERGRTSLAKVTSSSHRRYFVEEFEDGTLVLTPAVTVSALEAAALANPDVRRALDAAADPSTPRRSRGSFQQYLED